MCFSFLPLSVGAAHARFSPLGKMYVSIAVLIISVTGSDKKLLAIFTNLVGILPSPEALRTNYFINFSSSWTFTLFRIKQVDLFKLSFICIILVCVSYLLITKSFADESPIFVS